MSRTFATPAVAVAGIAMALVVYISNILVQTPIAPLNASFGGEYFNYAQFTFPIAFLITDIINRTLGANRAYIVIAAGFIVGGIMSILGGDVRIGIASMAAFAIGQVLDVTIFNRLRAMAWWIGPLISSLIASLIDTWIFYAGAFYGQDWPWQIQAWIDYAVKVLVALFALMPFRLIVAQLIGNPAAREG